MANVFDQFDAGSGGANVFDQFDASKPAQTSAKSLLATPAEAQARVDAMPPMLRGLAGIGEAAMQMGSGAAGSALGGLAGLGAAGVNALGGDTDPAGLVRAVQSKLTYQPRTTQGQTAAAIASMPFDLYNKGVGQVADIARGDTQGGSVRDLAATTLDVLGQSAPTLLGARSSFTNRAPAPLTRTQQTALAGQDQGFVIPPAMVGANSFLEGVGGKAKTQQVASLRNQTVMNDIAAEYLGLPAKTEVTTNTLKDIRVDESKAYQAVRDKGGQIVPDVQLLQDALDLSAKSDKVRLDFPGAKMAAQKDIGDLAESLYPGPKGFTAGGAIDYMRTLRADAQQNLAAGRRAADPDKLALGTAQKSAADAIENVVERNLAQRGDTALLDAYRAARTRIAKTYTVEDALNDATGNVSLRQIGKSEAPLTGPMASARNFAQAFPKAAQAPEGIGGVPSVSPLDVYGSVGLSAVGNLAMGPGGGLLASGVPLARNMAVPLVLSKRYQRGLIAAQKAPSVRPLMPGLLSAGSLALEPQQ